MKWWQAIQIPLLGIAIILLVIATLLQSNCINRLEKDVQAIAEIIIQEVPKKHWLQVDTIDDNTLSISINSSWGRIYNIAEGRIFDTTEVVKTKVKRVRVR